jgi:signal transduction histidine kinase
VAAAALPRLFEPFYTTKASGTGLGLAISATIAREHGGQLTAENRPGGGAVFRLKLPAADLAPVPPPL